MSYFQDCTGFIWLEVGNHATLRSNLKGPPFSESWHGPETFGTLSLPTTVLNVVEGIPPSTLASNRSCLCHLQGGSFWLRIFQRTILHGCGGYESLNSCVVYVCV